MEEWGYCPSCGRMVRAKWEEDCDVDLEFGQLVYDTVAVCPECGDSLPNCIECANFECYEEDRDKPPWFNARGRCPLGTVLAGNRACTLFKPLEEAGEA
jgi:hypothetical protein